MMTLTEIKLMLQRLIDNAEIEMEVEAGVEALVEDAYQRGSRDTESRYEQVGVA